MAFAGAAGTGDWMNGKESAAAPEGLLRRALRTKSLDSILADSEKPEYQLRRALGPVQLILLGIGAIVGAGIFATIGTAAAGDTQRPGAGPALMLSFVITAVVCGFTALCYAELASMVPISGSAYTYSYATLGELIAWIIGWDLIIEYAVGNVGVAISWANYFNTFLSETFNVHIPPWLSTDYRTAARIPGLFASAPHVFGYPIVLNLLAASIVAFITIILCWGVRESARMNAGMVIVKILVLTFFIVIGAFLIEPGNWKPFMPNGWTGISTGAAVVFFAYIGFDAVSTVAEETRNPARNMPIGIIGSLLVCTVLYVVVSAVFTGLISYPELQSKLATEQAEPLTMALKERNAPWFAVPVVAFGSVIAHMAVLLVYQLGQPRIFFSMARDGLLPPIFAQVHPRFRTPFFSTILTGVLVGGASAFATIDEMVDLTNIGTLFAFILVCAGLIVLRVKDPDRPRPFRVAGGWKWAALLYAAFLLSVLLLQLSTAVTVALLVVGALLFAAFRKHIIPVLGIVSCAYLIYYLPPTSWLRFAAWLNFGFVIYVGYSAVHSRLTGRHLTDRVAEHDAVTARMGAWLAVIGAALLIFMRAFDVWLEDYKLFHVPETVAVLGTSPTLPFPASLPWAALALGVEPVDTATRLKHSLAAVIRWQPWLEVSWFLIVPLALNAFVLAPIIIGRVQRARRESAGGSVRGGTASIAIAGTIAVLTSVYFGAVLVHNLPSAPSEKQQASQQASRAAPEPLAAPASSQPR